MAQRPISCRCVRWVTASAAIVFLHDPRSRAAAAVGVLCEVFGLTEAEGALAQALQTGVSLAEYTEARALSLNTVYTHLRRLREKTGCSRMPELIAKLYNLRMPLRLE
jgi:DNA-binding CsgD family transcriptional regulator